MEILGLVDLPFWLLCILSTILLLYLYTSYMQSYFRRLGIPSKPVTPMLGDFPLIVKKGFGYIDAEMVQKNGKCFGTFLGNYPELIITDPEMIKQITVKEFSKFTDKAMLAPLEKKWESAISVATGTHWKYLRSTLSPSFSSGKMRHMTALITGRIDILKNNLKEQVGTDFDIAPHFKGFTMDVICSTGFGLDVDSQKEKEENMFVKHSKEFLEFNPGGSLMFMLAMFFPTLTPVLGKFGLKMKIITQEAMDFFAGATKAAFGDRKQSDSRYKDLLQMMIDAQRGKTDTDGQAENGSEDATLDAYKKRGMTDEEILLNSLIFMAAGYETTASTLIWLSYCLAVNPETQDKLIEEIDADIGQAEPTYDNVFKLKYLDMVVNETLRLYPVAARTNRQPVEDVEVCGKYLPKGLDVTIAISALHALPEYWPNPEKFDPERFSAENEGNIVPYSYLPFGTGPRSCIGMRLALLEVKMAIVAILQTYRLSPSPALKIPPAISVKGLMKPRDPMLLKLTPRETTM